MDVGLRYGFHGNEAAQATPMTEEERRIWFHPGQHTSMMAFLLTDMFEEETNEQDAIDVVKDLDVSWDISAD